MRGVWTVTVVDRSRGVRRFHHFRFMGEAHAFAQKQRDQEHGIQVSDPCREAWWLTNDGRLKKKPNLS
jgi:hypothetical protein